MDVAVIAPERDRPHRHAFDHAGLARDVDDVADPDGVAEEDKEAGDQILDQRLRAETDGETHDTGTGEQGCGLDAEVAQGEKEAGKPEDEVEDVGEYGCERAHAVAVQGLVLVVLRVDDPARENADDLDRDDRDRNDQAEPCGEVDDGYADVRAQPFENAGVPRSCNGNDGGGDHENTEQELHWRRVAASPFLNPGWQVLALHGEGHAARECFVDPDRGQARQYQYRQGHDGGAAEKGDAARYLQCPDEVVEQNQDNHDLMPSAGKKIAGNETNQRRIALVVPFPDRDGYWLAEPERQHDADARDDEQEDVQEKLEQRGRQTQLVQGDQHARTDETHPTGPDQTVVGKAGRFIIDRQEPHAAARLAQKQADDSSPKHCHEQRRRQRQRRVRHQRQVDQIACGDGVGEPQHSEGKRAEGERGNQFDQEPQRAGLFRSIGVEPRSQAQDDDPRGEADGDDEQDATEHADPERALIGIRDLLGEPVYQHRQLVGRFDDLVDDLDEAVGAALEFGCELIDDGGRDQIGLRGVAPLRRRRVVRCAQRPKLLQQGGARLGILQRLDQAVDVAGRRCRAGRLTSRIVCWGRRWRDRLSRYDLGLRGVPGEPQHATQQQGKPVPRAADRRGRQAKEVNGSVPTPGRFGTKQTPPRNAPGPSGNSRQPTDATRTPA